MGIDRAEMSADRVFNFSAGPCCLPEEVLVEAREKLLNYEGEGMSVMEMSHRSKAFVKIFDDCERDLRSLLNVPENFKIMFLQGGATQQFSAVPLNLLGDGDNTTADYLITGQWGEKSIKEANKYAKVPCGPACNTKSSKFTTIPDASEWKINPDAKFIHYCANETMNGVEWHTIPEVGDVPLVVDVSSNFLSRPIDFSKHVVVYAGAQKNAGPAGCTVVIVREDYIGKHMSITPITLEWKTFADANSMYNTPPCWAIYMMGLTLKYYISKGGIAYFDKLADEKATKLYAAIDGSNGFYKCTIDAKCRSRMNVCYIIEKPGNDADANSALEKEFVTKAKEVQCMTLAGHRNVGGIRASLYNGMPIEGVDTLIKFMADFQAANA